MWMKLPSSYSQIMFNEDLTDKQEENITPTTKAKDDDCQSPPTKTFPTVKEMKEAFSTSNSS